MNTPTPRTDAEITLTGAYTCTHHNDAMRAACPVCLVTTLTAERDQLRAEVEQLRSDRDCEKRLRKDADEFRENAIARAERAEDNLAALEQCHDDNCRGVVKIAAELDTEREKAERYRLVTLKQDAELATERARLDWVFHNCTVTSDDFTVHDREDLGVAMKEDAK